MIYGNYKWQVDSRQEPAETYGNFHPVIIQLLKKGDNYSEQIHKFFIQSWITYITHAVKGHG